MTNADKPAQAEQLLVCRHCGFVGSHVTAAECISILKGALEAAWQVEDRLRQDLHVMTQESELRKQGEAPASLAATPERTDGALQIASASAYSEEGHVDRSHTEASTREPCPRCGCITGHLADCTEVLAASGPTDDHLNAARAYDQGVRRGWELALEAAVRVVDSFEGAPITSYGAAVPQHECVDAIRALKRVHRTAEPKT